MGRCSPSAGGREPRGPGARGCQHRVSTQSVPAFLWHSEGLRKGAGLGLPTPNPTPRSWGGRAGTNQRCPVCQLSPCLCSPCFHTPHGLLPKEGPIRSSKAPLRHQEQLPTRSPHPLYEQLLSPVCTNPLAAGSPSPARIIALACYLSLGGWMLLCIPPPQQCRGLLL